MQLIHHVVMTTNKRSIDPGRFQDRQFEGSFQEPPTPSVVNKNEIPTCEAHRKRASGDVVGTQIPGELLIEVADSLVRVRVTRNSANWVDLQRGGTILWTLRRRELNHLDRHIDAERCLSGSAGISTSRRSARRLVCAHLDESGRGCG